MTNSYKIRFVDRQDIAYEIRIYPTDEGYDEELVEEILGAAQPIVTEEEDDDDLLLPLRYSTGYVNFIDQTSDCHLLHEMTPENGEDISVDLVRVSDGEYCWRGYVQQQAFTQKWDVAPLEVQLPIISQLGMIANMNFSDNSAGSLYSVGEILRLVMSDKLTKALLPVNEFCALLEDQGYTAPIDVQAQVNTGIYKEEISLEDFAKYNEIEASNVLYTVKTYGDMLEDMCKFFGWTMYEHHDMLCIRDNNFNIYDSRSYRVYTYDELVDDDYVQTWETKSVATLELANQDFVGADNNISAIAPMKALDLTFGDDDWDDEIFDCTNTARLFLKYDTYNLNIAYDNKKFICHVPQNNTELTQYVYDKSGNATVGSILVNNINNQSALFGGGQVEHFVGYSDATAYTPSMSFTSIILSRLATCTEKIALKLTSRCSHLFPKTSTSIDGDQEKYSLCLCLSGDVKMCGENPDFVAEWSDTNNDDSPFIRMSVKIGDKYLTTTGNLSSSEVIIYVPVIDGKLDNNNSYASFASGKFIMPIKSLLASKPLGQIVISMYTPYTGGYDVQYLKIDNFNVSFKYFNTDTDNTFLTTNTKWSMHSVINSCADSTKEIKTMWGAAGNKGMLFSRIEFAGTDGFHLCWLGSLNPPTKGAIQRAYEKSKDILCKERIALEVNLRREVYGLEEYTYNGYTYRVYSASRDWREAETTVKLVKLD